MPLSHSTANLLSVIPRASCLDLYILSPLRGYSRKAQPISLESMIGGIISPLTREPGQEYFEIGLDVLI